MVNTDYSMQYERCPYNLDSKCSVLERYCPCVNGSRLNCRVRIAHEKRLEQIAQRVADGLVKLI